MIWLRVFGLGTSKLEALGSGRMEALMDFIIGLRVRLGTYHN